MTYSFTEPNISWNLIDIYLQFKYILHIHLIINIIYYFFDFYINTLKMIATISLN